jgi:two-component system, OmpR family, sensor kinase
MSLRLRLALWCGGLAGITMLLVCSLIYTVHSRTHYDDLDRALLSAAEHVAREYASAEHPEILSAPVTPQIVTRVYGAGGQVLAATPNAAAAPAIDPDAVLRQPASRAYGPLVRLAPSLVAIEPAGGAFGIVHGANGARWRVYVLPAAGDTAYLAAASLADLDTSVARLRRLIMLLAALGTGSALLIAWFVAGRALRPVTALTDTAQAIARAPGFGERVPVGAGRDELGRLARTFNEMLASLERAYQAQHRFVADASHELRAPLTAIQANLDLLERRPAMPPADRQEAVAEASREAGRLARLVADLLALARADAGVSLRRQRVEFDRLALDALGDARHLARGQRLEVEQLEPALVDGDPDRLQQLLLILLDNAIKYTPPGGRVALALRREGDDVLLTVADTGVGIAEGDLERVFERFYRADPARARDPGGTGLGLPIARWIADEHGGTIALSSAVGRGTLATVRLPFARG